MQRPHDFVSTRTTPQTQPIPGADQVRNDAGGFVFELDLWGRLDRYLILGSDVGTYYAGRRDHTQRAADSVVSCLDEDGQRVVDRVVEISEAGRAPSNDPALFVLAMASALGDAETRHAAFGSLRKVARTATHLFHFLEYRQAFGGWGRSMRWAVSDWYTSRPADSLAYQMVKYRQRDGWTHEDALRLAHPKAEGAHAALFAWATGTDAEELDDLPDIVHLMGAAQSASSAGEVADLVAQGNLPREALPTAYLRSPEVWAAMLEAGMPMHAMIRNLGNMSKLGLLDMGSEYRDIVVDALMNRASIKNARVHPIQLLSALRVYGSGSGVRGDGSWVPDPQVMEALEWAFYESFGTIRSSGKRTLLALDVSASMGWNALSSMPHLSCYEGAAAMAMVTARTEQEFRVCAFSRGFQPLSFTGSTNLREALSLVQGLAHGGTDCSLPMRWALEQGLKVDTFVVYTDNETWAGREHPVQALRRYREKTGIEARLAVCAFTATPFTIADPADAGMMDVVGFDAATPNIISMFSAGEV